jgi:hypothetical protein
MLVFYEQTNINPFKNVFIGQFEFAVNTYFWDKSWLAFATTQTHKTIHNTLSGIPQSKW